MIKLRKLKNYNDLTNTDFCGQTNVKFFKHFSNKKRLCLKAK